MANESTNERLISVGVPADVVTATDTVGAFNQQNMSPSAILEAAANIPSSIGGLPGIGSSIPMLGKIGIPGLDKIGQLGGILSQFRLGQSGTWEAIHYAQDLLNHQPKPKFLFKVKFEGFDTKDYYYFVHRIDKPKVKLQHTDINYYNFRTRVLTHVTYDPMTITFLDESGNSVNEFFANYMKKRSGQANGNWGINSGFGAASSSLPYGSTTPKANKGYSELTKITIEQIFANGNMANRFEFANPRIESFDFDELNMDENAGSSLTMTFTYDAIRCTTTRPQADGLLYTWGQTDLLAAGGTSGKSNAGATSQPPDGGTVENFGTRQTDQAYTDLQAGSEINTQTPESLNDTVGTFEQKPLPPSSQDVKSKDYAESAAKVASGKNMQTGGSDKYANETARLGNYKAPPFYANEDARLANYKPANPFNPGIVGGKFQTNPSPMGEFAVWPKK